MAGRIGDSINKAEKYLTGVEEAVNLFEAVDFPPSRLRAILKRAFQDYFSHRISEETLIAVGSILRELEWGTWDYDPEVTGMTCDLDDLSYQRKGSNIRENREKLYQEWYRNLSQNETVSVSLSTETAEKLEMMAKSKRSFIGELIREAVQGYLERDKKSL